MKRVLLYNPRAPYFAMPLALLALASELKSRGYDPHIVDGRLERDPVRRILELSDGALMLGVTVLTGAPLADALALSRAVRQARPQLPIVWGGWHPSIFPSDCASEPSVDAAVVAQGERAAVEIAERLSEGTDLSDLPGVMTPGSELTSRPFVSPDELAPHDYGLLDLEQYFQRKGLRQLEYVSSQGCPFSCSFCSDPMVYRRRWAGLSPERSIGEIEHLARTHRLEDLAFQDEIFFVDPRRSLAIADGLLTRGVQLTWTATARVEEVLRLGRNDLPLLARSGLRKLIIGAESGEPEVLARIHKGIETEQILEAATLLDEVGIAGHFNFIVGFPFDETPDEVEATLRTIRELESRTRRHEFALFYYAPYPGSPIFEEMAKKRPHELPGSLEEWASFDYARRPGSWVSRRTHRRVEDFKFYAGLAPRARGLLKPLAALAALRNSREFYALPLERLVGNFVRRRFFGHADV